MNNTTNNYKLANLFSYITALAFGTVIIVIILRLALLVSQLLMITLSIIFAIALAVAVINLLLRAKSDKTQEIDLSTDKIIITKEVCSINDILQRTKKNYKYTIGVITGYYITNSKMTISGDIIVECIETTVNGQGGIMSSNSVREVNMIQISTKSKNFDALMQRLYTMNIPKMIDDECGD